jgi:hypothetical protein
VLAATACTTTGVPTGAAPTPSVVQPPAAPVLLTAGDIVSCSREGHHETAALLDEYPDALVQTLGDNAYDSGNARQFGCYDESWGRAYERTRPALGGHDYRTPRAAGYMDYFREALKPFNESALDPDRGWYAYDIGTWRVIVLNSVCDRIEGGCDVGSPQVEWLRSELAENPAACSIAVLHNPRFSSGRKGNEDEVQPMWEALYEAGVELVLSGDNHTYERLAPMTPEGDVDDERGVRQFVVGTGGRSHYDFDEGKANPNSEVGSDDTFGVLKLTLEDASYAWEFLAVAGRTFIDIGQASCH